jgi:hypothetical protein
MTAIDRHLAEPHIKPVKSVTCDIKPGVHGLRKGCQNPKPWQLPTNIADDIYSDDDLYYEDWSRQTDATFGKVEPLNLWAMLLFLLLCLGLLWALHHYGW